MSESIGTEVAQQPLKPCYLFDLTTTAKNKGRMTGIPRTEFSLAKALLELFGEQLEFVIYSSVRGNFYPVPIGCLDHTSCKQLLDSIDNTEQDFAPAEYPSLAGTSFTMFTCGYAWNLHLDYTEALVRFVRTNRGRLCVLVHDLIPYLFPYWIDRANVLKFNSSLSVLSQQADLVVCDSRNTQRDFIAFCETERLAPPESGVIRLGDQPDSSFDRYLWKEDNASSLPLDEPFVLAVGAIQRRKNYELLHAAWKKLIAAKFAVPQLVIVGGCVAGGHEALRMFLEDQEVARHVLIMPNVSDSQLEFLYRNALFTVYPSLYEGWGLPVCESFRLGKICLASDNSSIPEIFPGYPELLSANNADLWAERISHFASDAAARRELEAHIKQNYQPHSWKDTARELRDCLRASCDPGKPGKTQRLPLLKFGDRIDFSQLRSSVYPSSGWKEHESWGRWARGPSAGISFAIEPNQAAKDIYLLITMKCSRGQDVNILVNGSVRETCHVGTELENYICPLCKQDLASGNLEIVLETPQQSSRPVGAIETVVGVSQLSIEPISPMNRQSPGTDIRRVRIPLSAERRSLTVDEPSQTDTRNDSSSADGVARATTGQDHGDRESLTPLQRLRESQERYLNAAHRTRECEKQLRKLPRQIQYRLGAAIVKAIDRPATLLFAPWQVTMLLIEALRGRAARRDQTLNATFQLDGKSSPPPGSNDKRRVVLNPVRASDVWLNCFFNGPQGQRSQFVVRANGRIIRRVKTRTKTFSLIKVDLQDAVPDCPANVSIELEGLPRGDSPPGRCEIVEALVDENDFILIKTPTVEPVTINLNETVLFDSEIVVKDLSSLGFGWKNCDEQGLNSAGPLCELEFRLSTIIEKPELTINLKWKRDSDSAAGIIGRVWAFLKNALFNERTVLISLNDKPLGKATFACDEFEKVQLSSPNFLGGAFAIRFEFERPRRGEYLIIRDLTLR